MPATSASRARSVLAAPPYKRDVNTVFQAYALFPHLSVAENVAYGLQQRRTPEVRGARARHAGARHGADAAVRRPQAHAALRRPAAARRARPRAGEPPRGAAPRRAARRPRPSAARRDAARAEAAAVAPRHHVRLRHARPGRGPVDERPHRDHARGPHRAARRRRHRVRPPGLGLRRGVRRPAELLPRPGRRGRRGDHLAARAGARRLARAHRHEPRRGRRAARVHPDREGPVDGSAGTGESLPRRTPPAAS